MVSIGLMESNVTVQESVRSVVVCVRISKRIARALAFRVTTRNGTAKGELIPTSYIATMNYQLLTFISNEQLLRVIYRFENLINVQLKINNEQCHV